MTTGDERTGTGGFEPGAEVAIPAKAGTPAGVQQTRRPGVGKAFASLSHRNYRLWFAGQTASLMGTWMQVTAQGFLVFELTNSPAALGYVGFATGVPFWLFTLYGGVISDRMPRRNLVAMANLALMVLAFVLAALTFLGMVQAWHIVVLAFLLGTANAFEAPARQAFVVELVGREDLGNAIALNATMFNLGAAIGPAVAGIAYALVGPGWCFTLNGLSFIAVISALLMMRVSPAPRVERTTSALAELKDGLRYVASHQTIRVLIATVAVTTVFGFSYSTLFPAWAVNVLGGDSLTNGFLQSARGLGSLVGAFGIASLGRIAFKGKLVTAGSLILPTFMLAWAATRWLPLSLVMLFVTGVGSILIYNLANVLVQSHVSDHLRGRVMALHMLALMGMTPVGSLFFGGSAELIGEPLTVTFGALVLLALAGWLWLRMPHIRALE